MVTRAEKLHDSLDAEATYPFDYVAYRLTGYRRDYGDAALLVGLAVAADLRRVIDRLSKSVDLPAEQDAARPADAWAKVLGVSTKTLLRWRDAGLRWRWIVPEAGGRKLVGYTAAAVEHFKQRHPQRFTRASGYSQMDEPTRRRLIDEAQSLAHADPSRSLNDIALALSQATGRAHETVRLLLEKHDRQHPDAAIFPNHHGPLRDHDRRRIARLHRRGLSITALAERYGKSTSTIRRAVNQRRVRMAQRIGLSHVASPLFDRPDADEVFLRPRQPRPGGALPQTRVPLDGLPAAARPLYQQPVYPPDEIRSLFLRFNYLKHSADKLRAGFTGSPNARTGDLHRFEQSVHRAGRLRSELIRIHLPAVLSVARRHLLSQPDAAPHRLIRLLEAGNPVLVAAVNDYNASQNTTFERFLTNRLLKHFATVDVDERRAVRREAPQRIAQRLIDAANESGAFRAIEDHETNNDDDNNNEPQ